ncbi:immunity protein Imm33 domain-containing protein [Micromonospora chokoriensis]|uniref:immunity protein Imm33 domain-containing protein n=1 Tax=Micromonospora chokoriensis TaxID=356851 RepID=UPI001E289503|nr:hypothetical protein [Micromonospora chokoriensis]
MLTVDGLAPHDVRRDQLASAPAGHQRFGGATRRVSTIRGRAIAADPADDGRHRPVAPRELEPLNALRHPIAGNSNGWFVWRGPEIPQDDDGFFAPVHIEHLDEYARELEPYLALPPGWGVVLAPDYEDVWYDESLLDV